MRLVQLVFKELAERGYKMYAVHGTTVSTNPLKLKVVYEFIGPDNKIIRVHRDDERETIFIEENDGQEETE